MPRTHVIQDLSPGPEGAPKGTRWREIAGIIAMIGSVYLALSLASYDEWDRSLLTFSSKPVGNLGGIAGSTVADILISSLGYGAYFLPLFWLICGIRRLVGKKRYPVHLAGVVAFLTSLSLMLHLLSEVLVLEMKYPGGFVGVSLTDALTGLVSRAGAYLFSGAMMIISFILMSPVSLFSLIVRLKREKPAPPAHPLRPPEPADTEEDRGGRDELTILSAGDAVPEIGQSATKEKSPPEAHEGQYILPTPDLLADPETVSAPSREELTSAASGLERKLADFGIQGKIKQAHPGPVVTMYEFEPAAGVKINRIVSLSDDLALSLRAASIRVYPIPGKASIGIEVPNRQRATVFFKEVISSDGYQKSPSLLTLALGKDIFGAPVVADLARMPHLLVAGATGSGKSISMNAMILSLIFRAAPDEVKLLLIDPKLLELSAYSDIPHLLSPVVTNPREASQSLKKVVLEMEQRYRLLAEKGTRNIETFNRIAPREERLPYIVVFIDELADLMFTAPSDVENTLTRLAQMARAAGIHLILATQRPSVDVITGLIKANFPARISFQVTSRIDSRTILDAQGAEQLLGMGDMLMMIPGSKITRVHGAFVKDSEVREVTEFVRAQASPEYAHFESLVVPDDKAKGDQAQDERDDMYQKVIDFAESAGEVSISSIQRRFKIGFNRAARIMELLAEDGLVGPPRGAGKPRDFIRRR